MSEKVDVWMPLYVKDYLAATSRLSAEQHGAYLLLIMDYWLNGPLPDDDQALAQIAKLHLEQWTKHRPSIARFFAVGNGEWRHKRVDGELAAARDRRVKAKERGKMGAKARWGKTEHRARPSIEQESGKQSSKDSSAPAPAPSHSKAQSKDQEPNGSSTDAEKSAPEAAYTIPLTGGRSHSVTQSDLDRYRELYPSIDVEQSIRNIIGWLEANPKRKSGSVRGAKSRITTWLSRDQDKAGRGPKPNGSKPPIADDYQSKNYEGTPDDELPPSLR